MRHLSVVHVSTVSVRWEIIERYNSNVNQEGSVIIYFRRLTGALGLIWLIFIQNVQNFSSFKTLSISRLNRKERYFFVFIVKSWRCIYFFL